MKWLIASDVHGSKFYAEEIIKAFKRENADRILLLGDILYHGPRNDLPKEYDPKGVCDVFNEYKKVITCVRGNCDAEVDQMVLQFPILAEYVLILDEGYTVFATHGHKFDKKNLPPLNTGEVFLFGHTHVSECENVNGIICMNPGSASIPKENSYNGYMTLEKGEFLWKDFQNEVKHTFKR